MSKDDTRLGMLIWVELDCSFKKEGNIAHKILPGRRPSHMVLTIQSTLLPFKGQFKYALVGWGAGNSKNASEFQKEGDIRHSWFLEHNQLFNST